MFDGDISTLIVLTLIAMVAACLDAIAGGGGLITLPALLLAGLDPVTAIATNKLQGSVGTLSAVAAFAKRGLIEWRRALPIGAAALCASLLGAQSVNLIPAHVLSAVIPFVLVAVAAYFILSPQLTDHGAHHRLSPLLFNLTIIPLIGFYDGIFGPGAGSLYMAAIVGLLGFGAVRATALTKVANGASNVGGLIVFLVMGVVHLPIGLCMAAGALIGPQIGSALAVTFGKKIIKPLVVIIALIMAAKLFSAADNPVRVFISGMF
ncbi:MAG TPA: TSUP family transporter [Beijerinckiaceae bacterium]|jgi:hypothetical protein|nr:TSUP family transporter [Beijerinckiaceae bacterium]